MFNIYTKSNICNILDKIIFSCLFLYTLTFLLDLKINFLTTAFVFGLIKLIFIRPKITINSKCLYPIILFIICTFLSVIFNDVSGPNIANLSVFKSRFITPLVGFAMAFLYPFNKHNVNLLFLGFSFSFLINALSVIYQFIIGGYGERLTGINESYMLLCAVNLLILPIIFSLAICKSNLSNKIRLFYLITILINIPAVVFENTRIVYIGLGVIFPLIILFSFKNKIKAIICIILLFLYSFAFFSISPTSVNRFNTIAVTDKSDFSNYQRILMWNSSINMFIDYPIFGVGIGNWHEQYNTKYRSPIPHDDYYHPHNVFLDMLSEAGILGGISYLLLFIYLYYISIRNYLKKQDLITLAYIASLLAYTLNGLTDCMFCGYNIKMPTMIFYFFTGIYFILNKNILISFKNRINL